MRRKPPTRKKERHSISERVSVMNAGVFIISERFDYNCPFFVCADAPIQSKKHKFEEAHKLKQVITKTVNKKNEDDIRKVAYEGQTKLSQAQLAVQEHHRKQAENDASEAGSSKG